MMMKFVLGAGGRERVVFEIVAGGPPGVRMALLARVRVRAEEERARRLGMFGVGGGVWRIGEPGEGGRG